MAQEHDEMARHILRRLTGGRWSWPPVRVREVYPAGSGRVRLRGLPVRDVVSVKNYDTGLDIPYTQFGPVLELTDPVNPRCTPRGSRVDVTYEYGSKPSAAIQKAIDVLADELRLADDQDAACRLPDRVTSVNRQGVSWTVIDPQDFLKDGRTGLYEVDLVLSVYGKSKRRSRVFSPEYPPPDRISVEILPEPVEV